MSTSKNTFTDLVANNNGGGALSSINVWWSEKEPDRIHFVVADTRFAEVDGSRSGLRLVFSSNPKSADYSPGNFNRCARMLRSAGQPAPTEDVDEHKRHLRYRDALIATEVTE